MTTGAPTVENERLRARLAVLAAVANEDHRLQILQALDAESVRDSMTGVLNGTSSDCGAVEEFLGTTLERMKSRWMDLVFFAMQRDINMSDVLMSLTALEIEDRIPEFLAVLNYFIAESAVTPNMSVLYLRAVPRIESRAKELDWRREVGMKYEEADYLAAPWMQGKQGRNGPRTGLPSGNGEPSAGAVMPRQLGEPKPKRRGKNGPRTRSGSDGAGAGGSK